MWPFKRSYKEAPSLGIAVEILVRNRFGIWGQIKGGFIQFPILKVSPYRDEHNKQRWSVEIDTTGYEIKRED